MPKFQLTAEPGKQEVVVTHIFDAPRDLVFKTYTDPSLITQWWGPRGHNVHVDKMEVKMGGVWRFVDSDEQGNEYGFHGVYHDITSPERIVHTFEFEGMPGHALLETIVFEEMGNQTKMIDISVYQSVVDRDGMVSAGMESGARDSAERFDELLAAIRVK